MTEHEQATCPKCGAIQADGESIAYPRYVCGSHVAWVSTCHPGTFSQSSHCRIRELECENARLTAALAAAEDQLEIARDSFPDHYRSGLWIMLQESGTNTAEFVTDFEEAVTAARDLHESRWGGKPAAALARFVAALSRSREPAQPGEEAGETQ